MREFQFYISAIITIGFCSEPCQDLPVSILHKCDYNYYEIKLARFNEGVSILHKCDYNEPASWGTELSGSMFQFYISAIITRIRNLWCRQTELVSILHKCDYNSPYRRAWQNCRLVSILHKCDYNSVEGSNGALLTSFNST